MSAAVEILPTPNDPLTPQEEDELGRLEVLIENGIEAALEAGDALTKIRDGRLYRKQFPTFDAYVSERWKVSRQYAYRLMDHRTTVRTLDGILSSKDDTEYPDTIPMPTAPTQTKPLAGLSDGVKAEAWVKAVETSGGAVPSERQVQEAVARIAPERAKPKVAKLTPEEREIAKGRKAGAIPEGEAVTVEAPDPAPADAPAEPEPEAELSDADWLATQPARAKLADHCRERFDQDALAFRWSTPSRVKHARTCKPFTNRAKSAGKGHIGRWMSRHFFYLKLNDPSRWQACRKCEGKGTMPLGTELIECPTCRGEGYQL